MLRFIACVTVGASVSGLLACATTHDANWQAAAAPAAATDAQATSAALVAEGDALWAERADTSKLEAALAKWEAAAQIDTQLDLAVKLARGHYFLADGHYALADLADKRDAGYQRGLDWATTAVKLSAPEFQAAMAAGGKHADAVKLAPKAAVPALYWYASNLGKWASSKGFTTVLKYKDDIRATMEHVKSLDATYFYAGPWRYFGAFEAKTAGLGGGSLPKSQENFEQAVALAPGYLGTKVLWAEYLCTKKQDRAQFQSLLEAVIAADAAADPAIAPENAVEQKKAKKLLAAINDNF